jgi:hypothetical protein
MKTKWVDVDSSVERYILWIEGKPLIELGTYAELKSADGARIAAEPYLQGSAQRSFIFLVEDSRRALRRIKSR